MPRDDRPPPLIARRLLLAVCILVVSLAVVLLGPVGKASAYAGVPVPVAWPSTLLGDLGISAAGVPAATGAGSTVVPGAAAAGGGLAAAAAPIAVAAGGLTLGFSIGKFIGSQACAGGVELLCMPRNPDPAYVPNSGSAATPTGAQGWRLGTTATGTPTNIIPSPAISYSNPTPVVYGAVGVELSGQVPVNNAPAGTLPTFTASLRLQAPIPVG